MKRSRHRVTLVALCLVVAGCTSGSGTEHIPERATRTSVAGSSAAISDFEADVSAFVGCLRRRGVRVGAAHFDRQGRMTRWLDLPADVIPSRVRDAANACAAETPEVVVDAPLPDPRFSNALTEFVGCMRDQGIVGMPDPTPEGLLLEGSGVAPHSAEFRRAERRCEHILEGFE
jgi:hypothetical protein